MGSSPLQSRLRVNLGNTDGSGNFSGTVPGSQFNLGQMFSVGTTIFTVVVTGTPGAMLSTGVGTGTFNTTSGAVSITGAAITTAVYYYPALPVMGITQYEIGAINNHPTYAFDTEFAYLFTPGTGWSRSGAAIWHGSDLNFFWICNWQGLAGNPVLFATNFNATVPTPGANDDPIWSFDGTTWTARSGANAFYVLPGGGAIYTGPYVKTARIIAPFKNRLVLLNTVENDNSGGAGVNTAYVNRCRYSFNGSPFAANAWYEPNQQDSSGNIAAGAGFIDAATEEQIISAEFIKDRLIVYFERSCWELAYTGNEILPFVWQKLNTELGSQATLSTVPFDKEVLTIAQNGVHSCNGSNVVRIDSKIPDLVFQFSTKNNANYRTCGIRDYNHELVYWSYVDIERPTQSPYPNQMLVYNYRNQSWAQNDDTFTAFGYFEQQQDTTWISSAPQTWEQFNNTWADGIIAANQRIIIGGNQQGFVVRINDELDRNAPSLQITAISGTTGILTLTVYNHNLTQDSEDDPAGGDYVVIENVSGDAQTATTLNNSIFPVSVVDANTITINIGIFTIGSYLGGGTLARVSNIQITTKQFNPYDKEDRNVYVEKVNFCVERSGNFDVNLPSPQITVDYSPSSSGIYMLASARQTGALMGNSVLETAPYNPVYYPLEQYQDKLWHPVYFQSDGDCIQLRLYFDPIQIQVPRIAFAPFELQGMILYTQKTVSRMQ